MIIKPSIRQTDPQWYRRLKETILGIIDELRQIKVKGDGTTTRVTRDGDGSTVHAIGAVKTVYAKIIADNGDGTYNATEQTWDNDQWADKTDGRVWEAGNADNLDALIEASGTTGLVDRVVEVYQRGGDWIFMVEMGYVWKATADASSGTITAKRVNLDGSLATPEKTFDVLTHTIKSDDRGVLVLSADGETVFFPGGGGLPDGDTDQQILYWNSTDSEWQKLTPPQDTNDYALVSESGTLTWRKLGCG